MNLEIDIKFFICYDCFVDRRGCILHLSNRCIIDFKCGYECPVMNDYKWDNLNYRYTKNVRNRYKISIG